jgi:ketosteroid isomerase-like protein
MKQMKLAIALMATLVFYACNNSETSSSMGSGSKDSTTNSMDEQNLQKNRSIYTAIQTGDSATIRSLIADDAVDHQGPNGGDVKGGAEITRMLADAHNHVKGMKFNIVSDAIKGDYIFAMVDVQGTAMDNTMGMQAGKDVGGRSVDVVKIKDGKMVEHWGFMNMQDVTKMSSQPAMNSAPKKK